MLREIIEFFLPPLCMTCDNLKDGEFFCKDCLTEILRSRIFPPFCKKCGRNLKKHKCSVKLNYIDEVFAIFNYTEKVRDLIENYKFKRYTNLANFFAPFVLEHLEKIVPEFDIITFVPLHPSRERERGFNQNEIILDKLSKQIKTKYKKDILIRIKPTKSQAKIEVLEKRRKNVENAFRVLLSEEIKDKRILILDDVFTTGSTIEECAKVLKQKGASKVYALCIATSS
ncbi:MAG: ComF family protein [Candidatus Hydrothermales bacterium]